MVFYRKYRPQTIDDLDNTQVREKIIALLYNAINKKSDIPHAFLFTGPKGLGKTSTARLIAKAVNCENNAFAKQGEAIVVKSKEILKRGKLDAKNDQTSWVEPCNKCSQCLAITNGSNLDVIEIDAASNRGIDEIRELKEKINLSPVQSRKKIYIIDEVHMLTNEAFNALLKTLEEPPAHVLFMLCTTEEHKIPATIISRCFHIQFSSATTEELERSLQRIIKAEAIKIDPKALKIIAKYADGGFRDGTKLLEEAVAFGGDDGVTVELLENKLHIGGIVKSTKEFLLLLKRRETKSALNFIEQLVWEKNDLVYFTQELLSLLHEQFLQVLGAKQPTNANNLTLSEIKELVSLFSQAYKEIKSAYLPQLTLEMAAAQWCDKESLDSKSGDYGMQYKDNSSGLAQKEADSMNDLSHHESNLQSLPQVKKDEGVTVAHLRKQVGAMAKIKALYGEEAEVKAQTVEENNNTVHAISLLHFSANDEITAQWLDLFWKSIISEMKNYNHTIAGVLRSCKIKDFDRKNLKIEAAYQFHKDKLSEEKTYFALENICKSLLGSSVVVEVVLREK